MNSNEQKIDWLYRLKRKILLSILCVLAATIVVTMFFVAMVLRDALINDSKLKTRELAVTIDSTLHHMMLLRARDGIQDTLEKIVKENEPITQAFILNSEGRITYSSDKAMIGTVLDRYKEDSCSACHTLAGATAQKDAVLLNADQKIHRNISLIYNEKECYECHGSNKAINGKLIIDRSLESTFSLITTVELILAASCLICLAILLPLFSRLLSRGINQYILEIYTRNKELQLLYAMVERLSKTLDMGLLKDIVVKIFREILAVDEMILVLGRGSQEYSVSEWTSASGTIERKKISAQDPRSDTLQRWLDGTFTETEVSADAREVRMPIGKNGQQLALVIARKNAGCFDPKRLDLKAVISGHVAVALDNARLYNIAITDELTRTFTKRHFRQCIDEAFAAFQKGGTEFALLMMDLDEFKLVNDSYGHLAGDEVLKQLGTILRQCVRENDLVFRYGGEEFAAILPATDAEEALQIAERLRSTTEADVFVAGTVNLKLTISIGVATSPEAPSVHALILAADRAMYEAKKLGRNLVVLAKAEDAVEA